MGQDTYTMAATKAGELSARDQERVKFTFEVFDFTGNGTVDRYYIGDLLRALNLNPTNAVIEQFAPEKTKGVKFLKMDEFIPMFLSVKRQGLAPMRTLWKSLNYMTKWKMVLCLWLNSHI